PLASDAADVLRLRAFGSLRDVELDALLLVEALVALALDCGVEDEHVVTHAALDEAEAPLGVEPLHGTFSHADSLLVMMRRHCADREALKTSALCLMSSGTEDQESTRCAGPDGTGGDPLEARTLQHP